jgi:pimeloyl-ACP methyl ester carboxylesterase
MNAGQPPNLSPHTPPPKTPKNPLTYFTLGIAATLGLLQGLLNQGMQGEFFRGMRDGALKADAVEHQSFAQARKGFQTHLRRQESAPDPVPAPPAQLFRKVTYPSSVGQLPAYLSVASAGQKRPAIIWLSGGFCNCIDDDFWKPASPQNDQTAAAFWRAGIITMYPARRGGHEGLGVKEGFFGEVDDVIAAADYLAKQPGVDPQRIYLGGHSTGGTLALLVAAASGQRFRTVFSLGPVTEVSRYGSELPFDVADRQELRMRAPKLWLGSIQVPTVVIEGTQEGNLDSLEEMARLNQKTFKNAKLQFQPIQGATHFTLLAPTNAYIAQKILSDTGTASNIRFQSGELSQVFAQFRP